jgi:hypothetical protein
LFNFFRDCILFILYYLAGGGFGNSGYYSVFYAIAIHLDSACLSFELLLAKALNALILSFANKNSAEF